MSNVYGYSRSNRGLDSIDFQNEHLTEYAKRKGLTIASIYSDVNSGIHVGTQLQRLLHEIPDNSTLLVRDRARLSRISNDYILIHRELMSKNVKLVFTSRG